MEDLQENARDERVAENLFEMCENVCEVEYKSYL